jgi:hypothetical protein
MWIRCKIKYLLSRNSYESSIWIFILGTVLTKSKLTVCWGRGYRRHDSCCNEHQSGEDTGPAAGRVLGIRLSAVLLHAEALQPSQASEGEAQRFLSGVSGEVWTN